MKIFRFSSLFIPIFFFSFWFLPLEGMPFGAKEAPHPFSASKIYFSPEDKLSEHLIALIDKEDKSIQAAVYCLTHRKIANALIQAKKRGVHVELIVDPFSVKLRTPVHRMSQQGIEIFVWDPEELLVGRSGQASIGKPIMHDKFCILGHKIVWTGSFNFTNQADEYNQENAIVLEDVEAAKRFSEEFNKIKKRGCIPYGKYLEAHPKKKQTLSKN